MPRDGGRRTEVNLSLTELPDNKEDFQVVWLDANIDKSADSIATQQMLRILNANAQFYTESDTCVDVIRGIKDEKILLIISSAVALAILPQLCALRSNRAIFIFCDNREMYTSLLSNYPNKMIDIYTDRDLLMKSIAEKMKTLEKQNHIFNIFNQKQNSPYNLTAESATFLWYQLLIDVLKTMPADDQTKNNMLDKCADYYQNNEKELENIARFRASYNPKDAIKYYTSDSFLYKLLNKALRTEDIHLLYAFRFFIIDLCAQLECECATLPDKDVHTLYRGQQIPNEELKKLKQNVESLIGTNGFLSTSCDINVALSVTRSTYDEMTGVVFEIKADPKLKTVVFANISQKSEFKIDEEVLFSIGAVFKIDSCKFDDMLHVWKISMTATDQGFDRLYEYLTMKQHQFETYTPILYFGRLLMNEMGQIHLARTYFEKLLQTLPEDHVDRAAVYDQIGNTHSLNNNNDMALDMYKRAYEIRRQTLPDDHKDIASSLSNIGSVYDNCGDYTLALDYYQRSLRIMEHAYLPVACSIIAERGFEVAKIYKKLGNLDSADQFYERIYTTCEVNMLPTNVTFQGIWKTIVNYYFTRRDDETALRYLARVLDRCKQALGANHSESAYFLKYIGDHYEEAKEPTRAVEYYLRQLVILKTSQSLNTADSPAIATTTCKVVAMYEKLGDLDEAVHCYERAYSICEVNLLPSDKTFQYIWKMLFNCYFNLGDDQSAIRYLTRVLDKCNQALGTNHPESAYFLRHVAGLYEETEQPAHAVEYYLQELAVLESAQLSNTVRRSTIVECALKVAKNYEKLGDLNRNVQYYERAYEIYEVNMLPNHVIFKNIWKNIVNYYFDHDDDKTALRYLARALDRCSQALGINHPDSVYFLKYIGDHYEKEEQLTYALEYYLQELAILESAQLSDTVNRLTIAESALKVAKIYEKSGDLDRAIQYYERAYAIFEVRMSPTEITFRCTWKKVVHYYFTRGDDETVLRYLARVLETVSESAQYRDSRDESTPQFDYDYFIQYIDDLYEEENNSSRALEYYLQALVIFKSSPVPEYTAHIWKFIVSICLKENMAQTALSYLLRALKTCRQQPDGYSDVCRYVLVIGRLFEKTGAFDAAFQQYEAFLLMTDTMPSIYQNDFDELFMSFCQHFFEDLSFEASIQWLTRVHKMCLRILPSHDYKTALVLWHIGYLQEKNENIDQAIELYQDALQMSEEAHNIQRNMKAHALLFQTDILRRHPGLDYCCMRNDYQRAWSLLSQKVKMLKLIHADQHYMFFVDIDSLIERLHALGASDQMNIVSLEALDIVENATHPDNRTAICILEFISYLHYHNERYIDSLLFRQRQLELEQKFFSSGHSDVGWSLAVIGFIFYEMGEYDTAFGYLNSSLNILIGIYSNEHKDIWNIQDKIKEIEKSMHCEAARLVHKVVLSDDKNPTTLKIHSPAPRSLQLSIHFD